MAYLVNGVSYSTKKDATDALFAAAADGEVRFALASNDGSNDQAQATDTGAGVSPTGVGNGVEVQL